jgi:SAM-dependent methyltransferase
VFAAVMPTATYQDGRMSDSIRSGFEESYRSGTPPWDIGRPQPELVRLAEDGRIVGEVLDVGCGTGENALYLAGRGHRVVGVDGAPTAIESASRKAVERGLDATFLVADALELRRLRRRFETVVDCGLFHVFTDEERGRYVESLCEVLASGGVLHLLCFSDAEPPGYGPRRVSEEELRGAFRGAFALNALREARFASRILEDGARAWLATFTRI